MQLIRLIALALIVLATSRAGAATLLPPGKNCFFDSAGASLASGTVEFYVPQTMSPKDTWQDASETILNQNPVPLDAAGCAIIYGVGTYRQIVKDSTGQTMWDQPTSSGQSISDSWGGTSTGSANVQLVALDTFDLTDGQVVNFIAGYSNTSAMTLNVNSTGPVAVVRDSGSGPVALTGGEIVVGNAVSVLYSASTSQFHILTPTPIQSFDGALYFNGVISPTPLAADQNDWTPSGGYASANTIRITASNPIVITGLTGGASGRILLMKNIGSQPITFTANSTASVAANRFLFPSSVTLRPNDALTVQYDATSTGWRLITQIISQPVAAGFRNLLLVNGATPDTQIIGTSDAFTLEDSFGNVIRRNSLSCTADLTLSGAGGLDTGSRTTNTWYSYWFIYNASTNTDSCLLSTQTALSALTLPAGYTFAARAGWNRTNATGSGNLNRVRQAGRTAQYVVTAGSATVALPNIANGSAGTFSATAPTYATVSVVTVVPTTATQINMVVTNTWNNGAAVNMQVAPNTAYSGAGSINPPVLTGQGGLSGFNQIVSITLESTSIAWTSSGAGGAISALGWVDNF